MSAAPNAFETALLQHILQNADIAGLGDATGLRGSSAAGSLYLSLHTSDVGEAGSQTTNETSYTNYARVAIPRNSGGSGFGVTDDTGTNNAEILFPTCGVTGAACTHWALGTASSGAGVVLWKGSLPSTFNVASGIAPRVPAGQLELVVA
jgi:hypothetical protein